MDILFLLDTPPLTTQNEPHLTTTASSPISVTNDENDKKTPDGVTSPGN